MIEFYDVKLRTKVSISSADCKKTVYTSKGKQRYALKAVSPESGCNLTLFIKKEKYDSLDIPVV
jgi:HSP90 family molecular chaperone